MKRIFSFLFGLRFILLLLVAFLASDLLLTRLAPVENSTLFSKNDYERAVISHGGQTSFEKVIFGNSVVGADFLEEQSNSDYASFGIVYGTMQDLEKMLDQGFISPEKELVLMVNYLTFSDIIDTNPSYPWHRGILEPYVCFQRDRIMTTANDATNCFLDNGNFSEVQHYTDLSRSECHGSLSDEELDEIIASQSEKYYNKDLSYYEDNFSAAQRVIRFCRNNNIRLRVIYAPKNPYYDFEGYPAQVMSYVTEMFNGAGIDILDMQNAIPREGFYDLGHLNREVGAVLFTEAVEEWLCQ